MKTENHKKHTNFKKNKTKTETVSNKDTVKDSSKSSAKKPNDKRSRVSGAGKGDKLRRGITQDAWGEKWEKIFKSNKK